MSGFLPAFRPAAPDMPMQSLHKTRKISKIQVTNKYPADGWGIIIENE